MQGRVRGRRQTPHPALPVEPMVLPSPTRRERITTRLIIAALLFAFAVAFNTTDAVAQTKVRLAVGGKPAM
ncbi:MAG: hypothetical protein QOF91_1870, partial [Alphaproteobacteria bacterium]|nr:hypothetical protein [Alphaproteobacteria bacterium]